MKINEVATLGIHGKQQLYIGGVEVLRDLMDGYIDKEFWMAFDDKKKKPAYKEMGNKVPHEYKVAKYKFRQLVNLSCRSGFIPAKLIKGELDEEAILSILHATGDLQALADAGEFKIVRSVASPVDKKQNKKV